MEQRTFPRWGRRVGVIGLGAWQLGYGELVRPRVHDRW